MVASLLTGFSQPFPCYANSSMTNIFNLYTHCTAHQRFPLMEIVWQGVGQDEQGGKSGKGNGRNFPTWKARANNGRECQ